MCGQWVGGLQAGVPGGHLGSLDRQQIVVACTGEVTVEMAKGGWTRETSRKWSQQKLRIMWGVRWATQGRALLSAILCGADLAGEGVGCWEGG